MLGFPFWFKIKVDNVPSWLLGIVAISIIAAIIFAVIIWFSHDDD